MELILPETIKDGKKSWHIQLLQRALHKRFLARIST